RFRETQAGVASLGQIVVAAGASSSITGCAIAAQLPSDCVTATAASWKTVPLAAPQTGSFTVEGTLTPPAAATSGAFALAANAPASGAWADLAAIVLFDDASGTIKARDGAAYVDAPAPLRYQAGAAYRIRMTVNVSAKTYAATVTPPGGGAVSLGSALRFRETQAGVASLGQIVVAAGASSSITGCGFSAQLPPPAAAARFGVIGDFGNNSSAERDVAQRVRSWNPDFVVTVGDNNYDVGAASTIDANIGQYYQEFIFPYAGRFGSGSPTGANRFFPALGNHDWESASDRDGTGPQPALPHPHLDYFQLPGNERYYDVVRGPVHLFVLDSDPREPDGSSATSAQAQWLRQRLAASTAPWKVVALHHAPFSSSTAHGSTARLQWPFQEWGAHAVLAGHDHAYERIMKNGMPYFVNGIGGGGLRDSFANPPVSGSLVRFAGDHGAMLVEASAASISFKAVTRAGAQIDSFTLTK
ncbi:MAG TPA: metallophosphoesterase, partial [Herpetosiphonaceae bacterium]